MILLCIEISLTLVTETFSIELEMEVTLLIPSVIELLSEISIVLGHPHKKN